MRIGRKTTTTSQRSLTLQRVVESEPISRKGNIHHQPQETSFPSVMAHLSSCLTDRGQNPGSVYSQHLISIYLIGMTSFGKVGLVSQVIAFGHVKGCQAHRKADK